MQPAVPTAPELVVLPSRVPAPPSEWTQLIIPNGPFTSRPPDPRDAVPRRPIEAVLPRDRSAVWLRRRHRPLRPGRRRSRGELHRPAQYRMVYADRHLAVVVGLEAAIPGADALIFACLGVALALQGRRALRAPALNVASVGASVFMNVIVAAPGWRNLAVWAMPPVACTLASDTLIGAALSALRSRSPPVSCPGLRCLVTPNHESRGGCCCTSPLHRQRKRPIPRSKSASNLLWSYGDWNPGPSACHADTP